jgi:hypothetical protein
MEGERQRNLKTASFIGGLENMSFEQTLKAEQPGRVEISVDMGGGVSMSVLTKKNKTIAVIVAELKARGSKVKNLQKKPIKVLKELLRKDELKRRKGEEGVKTMGIIKYIIPVSEEMIAFIPQAIKLRKDKRGIFEDEEDIP